MPEGTWLPIIFLAFGMIIIVGEIVILARQRQGFGPQSIRIIGITIVITIAAALSSSSAIPLERLTAVIGLLGTLAGYLAGKSEVKAE